MKILERLFGFNGRTMNIRTEILAGLTTFLTMSYILAVNPAVLSSTGMDKGAVFTATVVSSAIGTLVMAFYARLPFVLAPGMGLNAFFAYTVCLSMGYSWQFALTAVFLEGIIFIILTVSNLREKIVEALPAILRKAIGAGIGLFLAFLGLRNAGIIISNDATLIKLGDITSGPALLGIIGLLITSVLTVLHVRGAFLIGIVLSTLIGIPMGLTHLDGLISMPPTVEPLLFKFEWAHVFSKDMLIVVFKFLFVDMFDTIGTVIGVGQKAGMLGEDGKMPGLKQAFMSDAIGTTFGACLGTSTVTTVAESAVGVGEGGRSGLTALTAAVCMLASLFLAPFFLAVPGAATAPAIIIVGLMMATSVRDIDFSDDSEAIPALLCIIIMPLAGSISDGIILGMLSYVLINLCSGKIRKITAGMYILSAFFLLKFLL